MSSEQQFLLKDEQNERQNEQSLLSNERSNGLPFLVEDEVDALSVPGESLLSKSLLPEGEKPASCIEELPIALRDKDAAWCERLAVQAGSQHDSKAVVLLREILRQQKGRRDPQWLAARLAAAGALGSIGDISAIPDLCDAVLDRSPLMQRAASEALLAFGADASPLLIKKLEKPGNWSLSGMKTLIATLGRLERPESAVALSRVILGELPGLPLRWRFLATEWGLIPIFGIIAFYVMIIMCIFPISLYFGMGLAISVLLAFAYLILILPFRNRQKNKAMEALAAVAGDALYAVRNRNVLPVVIAAAFGPHPVARQQVARKALESLLPLLSEEDTEFFPLTARTYLILAVGYSGEKLDMALLRAMEYIGNGQAIPPVLRIARYGATEELRLEAARILPILHNRMEQAKASSMLLRASDQPLTQADQLLRASLESAETPAEELLRPAVVENAHENAPLDPGNFSI